MRSLILLCLLPLPALAQVTTNDQALQALKPATVAKPAQPAKPTAKPARHVVGHARPAHPARQASLPTVPAAPPPIPVILPPPPILPAHAPTTPPPVKLNPAAPTVASALPGGTRLVFGAGSADLNQASFDALQAVAATAKADPATEINVTAWAPGVVEDPSTPHRLSLDRALAARAVLIHAGIVSDRIHAVAKGFNDIAGGPPDRMDVIAAHPASTPTGSGHS